MNLYIKYGPLLYTYNTRIKSLWGLFGYLYSGIFFGLFIIILLFLFFFDQLYLKDFFNGIFIYVLLFIGYLNFYEIGYIYNDTQTIKLDSNPTIRVDNSNNVQFWKTQILIRLFFGIIVLGGIYYLYNSIFGIYIGNIIFMSIIYYLHNNNYIRKVFAYIITFFFLRLSKYFLIFIILYYLKLEYSILLSIIYMLIFTFILPLFLLDTPFYILKKNHISFSFPSKIIYILFIFIIICVYLLTKNLYMFISIIFYSFTLINISLKRNQI